MNKRSFVSGIVREAREQSNRIWEQVQQVRDRASMAHLEQLCWQMGPAVGREALSRALAYLEERREAGVCADCGRALQRQRSRRVYQTLVGDVEVKRWYGYCRRCRRGWSPLDDLVEGEGRLSTGLQAKVCEVGTEWGFARASLRPDSWSIDKDETLNVSIEPAR